MVGEVGVKGLSYMSIGPGKTIEGKRRKGREGKEGNTLKSISLESRTIADILHVVTSYSFCRISICSFIHPFIVKQADTEGPTVCQPLFLGLRI